MTLRQLSTFRFSLRAAVPLGLVATAVAAAAVSSWPAEVDVDQPSSPAEPLTVATVTAQRQSSYERPRVYTGVLRERRRSQLSFQRPGQLLDLLVDEGEAVYAGQTVGRLDDRHILAQQAKLEAQLAEAQAVLDEMEAGPRAEVIASKRAQLRELQAQRDLLEKQLERRREAVRRNSVSKDEFETFQYEFQAAAARVEATQQQLEELLAGTRQEQLVAQRARLAQLEAALRDVRHDLEDASLTAPFAGNIAERFVDEGAVVASGAPVLELVDNRPLEAWIGLPPEAISKLEKGQAFELQVGDHRFSATLHSYAPDLNLATRTRTAIFVLEESDPRLVPGQVARIALVESISERGYWLPSTALTPGERGLWSVFVAVDQEGWRQIERRDVELLDTLGERSFVRGTLSDGEAVVATGVHRVVVGQQVAVARSSQQTPLAAQVGDARSASPLQ